MRMLRARHMAARRFVAHFMAAAAVAVPSLASAQAWLVEAGVTARSEYNDNYFFSAADQQSAITGTLAPFVRVARKTETSDISGLLALGANKVWGLPESTNYVSVNFGLDGTLREERSTWTGNASFVRAPALQEVPGAAGVVLALAYTNAAAVGGSYTFALTERWSAGATAGWVGNSYQAAPGGAGADALSDNNQYSVGGSLGYAYSDRTRFTFSAVLSRYSSDITRSNSLTTTIGVAHEFSPRLTVSASVGGFWSDIQVAQTALVCPTTPILCDTGVVQRVLVTTDDNRRESGALYGGSIGYAISEHTKLAAGLSENLAPSSSGTVTRTDDAAVSLSQQFSERLTAALGATYTRTKTPAGLTAASTTDYYGGGVGISYRLADRWGLDAGYRYRRARYSQNPTEPDSNLVFLSIAYNAPGAPLTDWVGALPDRHSSPGAGPVSLPEQ